MIDAYIFVIMQPGFSTETMDKIIKIKDVKKASITAGEYDIIIRISIETLNQLHNITVDIQKIQGIKKTITSLIEKEFPL
jgi:DNA-binding Lrp family transcriptional regulator